MRAEPGAAARDAFAHRLRKNRRHWSRWAARRGYGAWRVYDRDVPEYPAAIDVYEPVDASLGTRVCVQEIDTGWQQDAATHEAWSRSVCDVVQEVMDVPAAVEPLVSYYRAIAGEHADWAEYRAAMLRQGKSLLRVTPRRWGPVATGGFPARLA